MRFAEKVAIVTGGGSGIGAATCRLFAQEGAKVVVDDMVPERVERVVGDIKRQRGEATGVVADVRNKQDIDRLVRTAASAYGRIDILVNNAGVVFFGGLLDTPEEQWDRLLETNFRAIYRCSAAVAPEMIKVGRGKIVNVASASAFQGSPSLIAYSATKAGVVGMTRAMALDLIRHKIFVNCVCPGTARTNIGGIRDDKRQPHELLPSVPAGYRAEPEEIAKVILFAASDDSDYMVGHTFVVDGGKSVVNTPTSSPWVVEGQYADRRPGQPRTGEKA